MIVYVDENDELYHYGTPRHSGRYPWGSGKDPYQNNKNFLSYVDDLKKQGLKETEIAKGLGISTTDLRAKKAIAKSEVRAADSAMAYRLKEKGYSNVAIGERMGINESSVRALLNPSLKVKNDILSSTAKVLAESVENKKYIDVGAGVENHLGISRTKLQTAVSILKEKGYVVSYIPIKQLGTDKMTTVMVLSKPGTTWKEVYDNRKDIKLISDYSEDSGRTFLGIEPPRSVSSKRVAVRYAEDGGTEKDGVIELRRGVDDISLGGAKYAQVRISVDGTHYLKGMAMYSDNLPKGVDIMFNTNKHKGTPMLGSKDNTVLKNLKDDPDNPFGAVVRQKHYIDKDGKRQLSALNIVNEEGDWGKWSKSLSSQMLSKQSPSLAKKQLDLAYKTRKDEYDEIMELTNPVVKKKLLESFADNCDSAAVHLKAAALPRQASHVILPFPDMKENEIYAPNYRNGEKVVLVRYPHGGIFEIPELTVNNNQRTAKSLIRNAKDAVGINAKVAERLSGADFDGDTVLVIPNNKRSIKTAPPLKGLKDFNPSEAYPAYPGMKKIKPKTKQNEMGKVSNLITDMTIKGATEDEIARAVRHSMVVIDAEKHNLNYKQSYIDNGIAELKQKYQGSIRSGASTLVSKASAEIRVPERKDMGWDPNTGEKIFKETGSTYTVNGKAVKRTTKSTQMYETNDAYSLSSGTVMESVYAKYANDMKALANQARKSYSATKNLEYSPSARKVYDAEVQSLKAKLNVALRNRPLERQAQILANTIVDMKKESNPDMEPADLKKIKGQALNEARSRVGASKKLIEITDTEWNAIQAGAVSNNLLEQIVNNTDLDALKKRATPRSENGLTPSKESRAKLMLARGYTQAEVADVLGISTSLLKGIQG